MRVMTSVCCHDCGTESPLFDPTTRGVTIGNRSTPILPRGWEWCSPGDPSDGRAVCSPCVIALCDRALDALQAVQR